ncbi:D-glucuronyl C5-epimerase [Echinococcus granulosus]|nr:D-glucuronyl C5-epimerase [Echinococcus granulosus]
MFKLIIRRSFGVFNLSVRGGACYGGLRILHLFFNLRGSSDYSVIRIIMHPSRRIAVICLFLAFILCIINHLNILGILGGPRITKEVGNRLSHFKSEDTYKPLMCSINGYMSPGCYQLKNSTLVVDFKHIKYWCEMEGYLNPTEDVFHISNGGAQSISPLTFKTHEPLGYYMGNRFSSKPEGKARILLVDAEHTIPISRQWDPRGHPYPIQIAQFGLACYSRYRTLQSWKPSPHAFPYQMVVDFKSQFASHLNCSSDNNHCSFGEKAGSVSYKLTGANLSHNLTALITKGANWPRGTRLVINVSLRLSTRRRAQIHFACTDTFGEGSVVIENDYWALGYSESVDLKVVFFQKHCRKVVLLQNLEMVLMKAVDSINREAKAKPILKSLLLDSKTHKLMVVDAVELRYPRQSIDGDGPGVVQELLLFVPIKNERVEEVGSLRHLLVNTEFERQRFMAAAEWLVQNQAQDGSWRISAKHVLTRDIYLKPGWCSAMGQGQGISLLVRASHVTGDEVFLKAAHRALGPFSRSVQLSQSSDEECGVRANFLGQSTLPWYEEYPAIPSVFVLNGFIYSLIGLYDLSKMTIVNKSNNSVTARASQLLEEGVGTLVRVLPLYDSGTGSFYDLRHLSLAHAFRLSPRIERLTLSKQGVVDTRSGTLQALLKAGPNRARWQYHQIHLLQLYQLAAVIAPQHANLWHIYFDRWLAYLWGFRSDHN